MITQACFWKTLYMRWGSFTNYCNFKNVKNNLNDAWQSWLAGLYPHLAGDFFTAALPHPPTSLNPLFRHPFHSGADEAHGRTTVVADGIIQRAQNYTNLSLWIILVWNCQREQSMIEISALICAFSFQPAVVVLSLCESEASGARVEQRGFFRDEADKSPLFG